MRKKLYDWGIRALHPVETATHRRYAFNEWGSIENQLKDLGSKGEGGAVLVGRAWNLGDVVASMGLLPAIREAHPESAIVYATSPNYTGLLRPHPLVDCVISCRCMGTLVRACSHSIFKKVYLLHFFREGCSYCGSRIGYRWNHSGLRVEQWPRSGLHIVDAMSRNGGISGEIGRAKLHLDDRAQQSAVKILSPLPSGQRRIALHLYSRVPHKNPSHSWWQEFASRLISELGVQIIIVGGGIEMEQGLPGLDFPEVIDARAGLRVEEMAVLISQCDVFTGPESGPAYIAEAVGTPAIVLKGHYLPPEIVGPRTETTVSVVSPVDCWRGKAVLDSCPRSPSCMESISVEEVMEAAARLLAQSTQ